MQAVDFTSVDFAKRLKRLLNNPTTIEEQYVNKKGKLAYSEAKLLRFSKLLAHLSGKSTIGFYTCESSGYSNLLGWDIDERFAEVRAKVIEALNRRKWSKGSFLTTGSDPERGKVILCIKPRIPQAVANRIAREIYDEVVAAFAETLYPLNPKNPKKFEYRPEGGMGGILRILGRKLRLDGSDGPLEQALDLNGKPSDLTYVRPVTIRYDLSDTTVARKEPGQWVKARLKLSFSGNRKEAYHLISGFAYEALKKTKGDVDAAESIVTEWCGTMVDLSERDDAKKQFKNEREIRKAVQYAKDNPPRKRTAKADAEPRRQPLSEKSIANSRACRPYQALAEFVEAKGLNPHCFGKDYASLGALAGYSDGSAASKSADVAENFGVLFRLHQGARHRVGIEGTPTLWCLRCEGETLQAAYDDGIESDRFRQYVEKLGPARFRLVGGKKIRCSPEPVPDVLPAAA
jgi:hypothetical protein